MKRIFVTFKLLAIAIIMSSSAQAQITRSFTEPFQRSEVSAAELGIVESVDVRVGDSVQANQLLGQLNSGVLIESRRLAQHRAESTAKVDAAEADLKLKQKMYENLKPLLLEGHTNPTEVDRAKTEYEQARASFRVASDETTEAKIELSRIEAQIRQRQIRSPIDGIVVDIHRRPGEYLPSSDPRFATVVDISKLRARFFVDTVVAQRLRRGDTLDVLIGAQQRRSVSVIEFVSPITESQSGTVRIDVLIDNIDQQLRSGVTCRLVDQNFRNVDSLSKSPREN